MKKKSFLALALALGLAVTSLVPALAAAPTHTYPKAPILRSPAAILIDGDTGQVLYGKNEARRMEPASLTKIMTCLLAVEGGRPDEQVLMTAEAAEGLFDSTTIYLQEGESLSMEDMLYALMLPSANDAANAVAIHLEGSQRSFVQAMNRRAGELNLTGTHFQNAHGLPAEAHYSTAYDLAQLTRAALQEKEFVRYAGAEAHVIPASNFSGGRRIAHLNRLLLEGESRYDGVYAGKTGWTDTAGYCLMTAARRGDMNLICIVLGAQSGADQNADTAALFDYGFENFHRVVVDLSLYEGATLQLLGEGTPQRPYTVTLQEARIPLTLPLELEAEDVVFSPPVRSTQDALPLTWPEGFTGQPDDPLGMVYLTLTPKMVVAQDIFTIPENSLLLSSTLLSLGAICLFRLGPKEEL